MQRRDTKRSKEKIIDMKKRAERERRQKEEKGRIRLDEQQEGEDRVKFLDVLDFWF